MDKPPLRLLLGSDAVQLAEKHDRARMESGRKWRQFSLTTHFEAGRRPKEYPWERK
jgi:hypothetical protein